MNPHDPHIPRRRDVDPHLPPLVMWLLDHRWRVLAAAWLALVVAVVVAVTR